MSWPAGQATPLVMLRVTQPVEVRLMEAFFSVVVGDEVAQFGEWFGEDGAVVEVFGLAEDEVQTVEGTLNTA